MKKDRIFKVNVIRHDGIDGFACYASKSILKNGGIVLINIEGLIDACTENNLDIKEALVETLMHEVGHALEDWFDLEFNEERIEKIIGSYKK